MGGRLLHLQQRCLAAELLCWWRGDHHVSSGPAHVPAGLPGSTEQGLPYRQVRGFSDLMALGCLGSWGLGPDLWQHRAGFI